MPVDTMDGGDYGHGHRNRPYTVGPLRCLLVYSWQT